MVQFDLVTQFGVRVHEVAGLDEEVIFVADRTVAFVRAELTPCARLEVAQWLFAEALSARMTAQL